MPCWSASRAGSPSSSPSIPYLQIALDEELIAGALRAAAAARRRDLPLLFSVITAWGLYLSTFRTRLNLAMRTLHLASARTLGAHPTELAALVEVAGSSGTLGRHDDMFRYECGALALARELDDPVQIIRELCDVSSSLAYFGVRAVAEPMEAEPML
jgi:hypothetical protein